MPRTKKQGIIFGVLMSFLMAYGMEFYNIAIKMEFNLTPGLGYSSISYEVFVATLKEAVFMCVIVFIVSNLVGNKAGAKFMEKRCDVTKDNPYFCQMVRQIGTCMVMCPTMSLIAAIIFQIILGGMPLTQLPAIWVGTVMKNFPMAFFWSMFFVSPFVHWIFDKYNKKQADSN